MKRTSILAKVAAVAGSVATLVASQVYYALLGTNLTYDSFVLFFGVIVPFTVGSLLLFSTHQRVILLGYVGLFWSVVDDAPVYLDSVLTWPEVTRFHPVIPHLFLEVVFHILTLVFVLFSVRLAAKTGNVFGLKLISAYAAGCLAVVSAYAQNIPVILVQNTVRDSWYSLDIVEHLVAVALFYFAIRLAGYSIQPSSQEGINCQGLGTEDPEKGAPAKSSIQPTLL